MEFRRVRSLKYRRFAFIKNRLPFKDQSGQIRLGFKAFVKFLVFHFLKVLPRSKKIIIWGSEAGRDFLGNPKYLFIKANEDQSIRNIWITKNKKILNALRNRGYSVHYYKSLKGVYYQLRAKIAVMSHSINDDFWGLLLGGVISINTWHGVGLKKVWGANKHTLSYQVRYVKKKLDGLKLNMLLSPNQSKTTYLFSTSKAVSNYYPETFLISMNNVKELGQARNDVFFTSFSCEEDKFPSNIKENYVITYMPTHRGRGQMEKGITDVLNLDEINQFCENNNCLFLIKSHMYSKPVKIEKYRNVRDVSEDNIDTQLLLKYSNILITDYSSCFTDYLLLNRPILFYCYDLDEYLIDANEMYFDYEEVTPGAKVKTFEEIMYELNLLIQGIDNYQNERKEILKLFYSTENQGPVIESQIQFINKLLRSERK